MRAVVTYLGSIRRVVGAKVLVEVSPEIPSSSPIIHGHVYRIGQVGSFVRIPLGFLNLYGVVSMVGACEKPDADVSELFAAHGQRWIEVQLVGESYQGEGFQRGISVFPTLDDEVHIVTDDDLAVIYQTQGPSMVQIGVLAASSSLPASVDIDKLVTRHSAILGSTGSGKSNTVAAILKALIAVDAAFQNASVVVIDPHGEYGAALQGQAKVLSIGDVVNPLVIPYWAMAFDELAWFLVDRRSAAETLQDTLLREYIFEQKTAACARLRAGAVNPGAITADSPIPFSLKDLWYHFDRRERVTYTDMARTIEALAAEGNAQTLTSARFSPPGAGSSAPFKPNANLGMASYVSKILGRLRDQRFGFLLAPSGYEDGEHDLDDLLATWLGHEHGITVLDLAGVPFEVMDLVVGAVTRILFEGMFWGRSLPGMGRQRPLLLVYEEAHGYLPRGSASQFISGYAGRAVRRVVKEGRKYGVGAMVVSQRPADLDETVLSQCGTFITLRLSNSEDQSRIRATVPESLAGLIDLIPALRTGEALVVGEAVQLPSRVRFPLVEPRPDSSDPVPSVSWQNPLPSSPNYAEAVTAWRIQRSAEPVGEGAEHGADSSEFE